ncbi:MAG: peptide deformylase [Thiohalorhabdus sp.]|uniref:peptide deformylase n=1 Tax=Thiohalorhabdus sp. TaxID=3094134 RepID=UPI0039801DB1
MAVREVLRMGDGRLLQPAEPVADLDSGEVRDLIRDLWDTMAAHGGVGLAAPQIGVPRRVVVFAVASSPRYPGAEDVPPTALVNPTLHPQPGAVEEDWEGCLSLPGLRGLVPRHARLRYTGFTAEGEPLDREVSGFHARVVQHECDHLDGILYPMRIRDLRNFGFEEELAGHPALPE